MKKVFLGIVCWNHWEIAARCLDSVCRHTDLTDVEFVIIDNGSNDPETIDWLTKIEKVQDFVTVIRNDKNYGIVGGMRKTFEALFNRAEMPEFTCLLNCDTLVTDGWLSRLVDVLESDDKIIAVEPKDNNCYTQYQHFNIPEDVEPEKLGFGLFGDDTKMQEYVQREFYAKRKHPVSVQVQSVDPPAALWRTALVKDCNGFSEQYDFGYGVMELFIRAQRADLGHAGPYKIAYCLSSFIYHYAHGGAGKYEGYEKIFGVSLNEGVKAMAASIKSSYGIDIATYGNANQPMEPSTLENEKGLVQL